MDTINTNIDTNSVDKKKKHFIPKLIAILTSAFSIIGVGTSLFIKSQYKSALAVSYDDDDYTITLNVNELNNYTFENLYTYCVSYYDDTPTLRFGTGYYGSLESSITGNFGLSNWSGTPIVNMFSYASTMRLMSDYKMIYTGNDGVIDQDLYLVVYDTYYDNIKSAIELDIQANQPYTNNTFLQDIVELLVGGLVAFGGGFATGFNSLVSALAIQNGAMSPFMAVVLCFGGLALAFGLSRWIVNLLSSLGQRNR